MNESSPAQRPTESVEPVPRRVAIFETAVITALGPMIGMWLTPEDPFFITSHFPWLVIAVALAGTRYGFTYGFGSSLALIIAITLFWRAQWLGDADYPSAVTIGLLMIGMITGEFSDMWMRRLIKISKINDYRRQRLDEFTRGYHLLKLSHDKLERRLAGSSQSLREAILSMRRRITENGNPQVPFLGLAKEILGIMSSFGGIQVAALYPVDETGEQLSPAIAVIGKPGVDSANDRIVQSALKDRTLVSVREELAGADAAEFTQSLAAIPLLDINRKIWGVVAVYKMPFMMFQDDNLSGLALIGGHIGDMLSFHESWFATVEIPEHSFRLALQRCIDDRRQYKLEAAVVGVTINATEYLNEVTSLIALNRRGLDQVWQVTGEDGTGDAVYIAMPLSDSVGVEGFKLRLSDILKAGVGKSIQDLGIEFHVRIVQKNDTPDSLIGHLNARCDIHRS